MRNYNKKNTSNVARLVESFYQNTDREKLELQLKEYCDIDTDWKYSGNGMITKDYYADNKYKTLVEKMHISITEGVSQNILYFSISFGAGVVPTMGREANEFYKYLDKLTDSKFHSLKIAVHRADSFAIYMNNYSLI